MINAKVPLSRAQAVFKFAASAGTLLALCASAQIRAGAQDIHFDTGTPAPSHAQRVSLDNAAFTVEAGKPGWIELHFHIAPGLHINSHSPKDETLVPTTFKADPVAGLRVLHLEFPPGIVYHLQVGAGETLSAYQNDFNLRIELDSAARGDMVLNGKLRYQACDSASCFPARDLPVQLTISAR